jgi:stage II sporulation protein AA (anti-sigma F factor antagonist)
MRWVTHAHFSAECDAQTMSTMTIAAEDGELVTVHCAGDISQVDFQTANPLENVLGPSAFTRKVVLNMERVSFLDSSGLGWLVTCHKRFAQQGGRAVLCAIPPRILQMMQFCHLDQLFTITEDEAAARAKILGDKS